ncbi:MAG: hypothetical protein ACSLFB_11000 [Acidimicrobiales bacterium]
MFKRLFWLIVGMAVGTGQTLWFMRRVRRTVDRYRPGQVTVNVADGLSNLGREVRGAVTEGRVAMNEREAELRARLAGRRTP